MRAGKSTDRKRKREQMRVQGSLGIFIRGFPAARLSGVSVGTGKEVYVIDIDTGKVYLYQLVGQQTREGVRDVETGEVLQRR